MPKHARVDEQPAADSPIAHRTYQIRPAIVGACVAGIIILVVGGLAAWRAFTTGDAKGSLEMTTLEVGGDIASPPETADAATVAEDSAQPFTSVEERLGALDPFVPTLADIAALPNDTEPFAFALNAASTNDVPKLSKETEEHLETASAFFTDRGWQFGYLLVDLGTGRGLASNLDARAYGASSFKAPYAVYLCETQLDTGLAQLDTYVSEWRATGFMDEEYVTDGIDSYPLEALVSDSIICSGNDPYRILRATYDSYALNDWLAGLGLSSELTDDWFPTYSTRESALLWLHTADYLSSDAASAPWLSSLLEQTETSFLRNALGSLASNVRDKAGWYADDDPAFCGIRDAGVVTVHGRAYLVCAMSSAPYSDESCIAFESALATIFEAREDLA